MIAFLLLTAVVCALLLFVARMTPVDAAKDKLTWQLAVLVVVALFVGQMLGSFPPFAANLRFYVWDVLVPGISEVSAAAGVEAPKATRDHRTLTIDTTPPSGYVTQVKYYDGDGQPHFELLSTATYELPTVATKVQVRFVKGNLVTAWTPVSEDTSASKPVDPPVTDPAAPADPAPADPTSPPAI